MNRRLFCLCVLLGASLAFAPLAKAQARFKFDTTPGHLSKQVVPLRYALTLELDPDLDSFTGQARISVQVRQPTPAIEVHAFELSASSARLISAGRSRALQVTVLPQTQTWRLEPVDKLPVAAGGHQLEFTYSGKVNVAGNGLFAAPHEVEGRKMRMLATQLEPIYARSLFPAFDEPSFRAVFEINVRAPSGYSVASNMPLAKRIGEGPKTLHRFAATPRMSSYLVSVAVGHFDVTNGRAAGIPLRAFTAQGKGAQTQYAMRVTRQVLPYYTRYFGVPYALPKLDQIAVPSVRWGAMEDWGLISYAEDAFLVDPQRSSPQTVRDVYATVAHEIAHQWFGNLVTAASWEEIWLNEAFATWLERKTTNHFNPDWKIPLQSRLPIDRAMTLDAGAATRAIRSGPVRETSVFDVFDPITYAKGGTVLTMLEQWIGAENFQRGLVAYMKGQRLSNATAADLWHYIGRASGKDVAGVAASWTDQQGFPLVRVRSFCESGRQHLALSQERFHSSGAGESAQLWKIPLRYARGRQNGTMLFESAQRSIEIGLCSSEPVTINAGGGGFYRVAYTDEARQALIHRFHELAPADRVTLLSDTFALMQSGSLALQAYFDVLAALPRVTDSSRTMLWSLAGSELEFLDMTMAGRPAQNQLRAIARNLLAPQLAALTWTPDAKEDPRSAELRGDLIALLARFDHAPTITQAIRAFDEDDAGTKKLPASLREPVTLATGMHADRPHFERLLARLKAATGEEERWLLAKALAHGRDAQRAEEFLAASLSGVVPTNVATAIPGLVAKFSSFGDLAYRYTLGQWTRLAELAGPVGRTFLLPDAAASFSSPEQAAALIEDQRKAAGADGDALAAQEAENIRLRAAIKTREAPDLEKGLTD